jgi:UDP-N-acetylglucosamine--N-acetylmuramyl-(pentapeptide) pyrophosphoryl-undecaprenol N-acetylglucosamine transferase
VRPALFAVPPSRVAAPRRLLALGGSQGARALNAALPHALVDLAQGGTALRVLHQTGADHLDSTAEVYRQGFESEGAWLLRRGGIEVELVPFVEDVPAALADAELVLSRAGAITLAELCAAGRAALLVPLELAGGHQERNAEALASAGAAVTLPERELGNLAATLRRLLEDPAGLAAMAERARALGRPDAARRIADRIAALAGREPRP